MPKREHHIPKSERGAADGTLGHPYGVAGLRLSADQMDHFHEEGPWKPRSWPGIPWRILIVAVGGSALIILVFILIFVVWPHLV
jgi:hypothetical protein